MAGDYSRASFSALKDFAGVLLQQGHPITDADWNEFAAILERRIRAGTVDTIGRAVVPRETPLGFQIQAGPGPTVRIGRGRMYVDGLLAENHGVDPTVFDRSRLEAGRPVGVLDELISAAAGDFVPYEEQPFLPNPPQLPGGGPHLAYLEVWRREVTALKDPRLLEQALAGLDTATRWQTVWQVRLLSGLGENATCGTPDGEIEGWPQIIAPSAARLTTATIEFEDPDEPCLIPPGGGYRGLENQLYRVEIHSGTTLANARFKWSRENASVGAVIDSFVAPDRIQVRRIGRDDVLRFRTGDWVEVTDDRREFAGLAGDLRRVTVDEDANELVLETALSGDLVPSGVGDDTAAARHSRVIRWDQSGQVNRADGTAWEDLDDAGSDGAILLPPAGTALVLEAGITVSFGEAMAGGPVRPGDHWLFAARSADASIEELVEAPPAGEHHHFARLAIVTFPDTVQDCRIFWPPLFEGGDDCACTVCVSPESHNTGQLTIQAAIASLPAAGGTVCLQPGGYTLGGSPVTIAGRSGVRLRGHGVGTVLTYAGGGGAIRLQGARDAVVDSLAVLAVTPATANLNTAAIHCTNCQDVEITGVTGLVATFGDAQGFGVALRGIALDLSVRDCLFIATTAIGADTAQREGDGPAYLALAELRVAENLLLGMRRGIELDGPVLHLGAAHVAQNLIVAGQTGILATGAGAPVPPVASPAGAASVSLWSAAPLHVEENWIAVTAARGEGIVSGVPALRLGANTILGNVDPVEGGGGACVLRGDGLLPTPGPAAVIGATRLGRTRGPGILLDTRQGALTITHNAIRDCGGAGLTMGARGGVATLLFDGNLVQRVATASGGGVAAGILVAAALEARITGNRIEEVGAIGVAAPLWAGIAVRGAGMLDISGNSLREIGPPAAPQLRIAIFVDPPFAMATIDRNRIVGASGGAPGAGPGPWIAIGVFEGQAVAGIGNTAAVVNELPVVLATGGTQRVLSAAGLAAFVPPREVQLTIGTNQIHSTNPGFAPHVFVQLRGGEGACIVEGNHSRLAAGGAMPALFLIQAPRLVVSNNIVRRESDLDAMQLVADMFGNTAMATVTGNLTFGNIRLNGGNLPPAFAPLNLLAS